MILKDSIFGRLHSLIELVAMDAAWFGWWKKVCEVAATSNDEGSAIWEFFGFSMSAHIWLIKINIA